MKSVGESKEGKVISRVWGRILREKGELEELFTLILRQLGRISSGGKGRAITKFWEKPRLINVGEE